MKKGKPKKGSKRAWCKKKLRKLFNVLTSSNSARVEATSRTLQLLNKARIFCSMALLIIVTLQPASALAMTPVIMVGNSGAAVKEAEKTCTFLCQVALTAGKFVHTKEGRTAVIWLAWSGIAKGVQAANLMAAPTYGTAAIALAIFCSTAYSLETVVGGETFVEFLNQANTWCAKGYGLLNAAAILPIDTLGVMIKLLEGLKGI